MEKRLSYKCKVLFSVLFALSGALRSNATHIFGVDLYYTHVSGLTYTIHLVMYGDCSGAAFGSLPSSTPIVNIYNGGTFYKSDTLALQPPTTGVEVTPVCPADVGLTQCTNTSYSIPGVKKFVYTANVTLSGTSSVWRFLFQGNMGGTSAAGRSTTITNITSPGTTTIQLVDTLDNTTYANSNAVYTSIPTPFFCLNVPANFNPGAVDPDADSLAFYLVSAVDGSTGSNVTYVPPYTATAPLATAPGTFSFNNATGQLAFTPNLLQRSLVVYNVEEYHGGVLRGTSQREMTIVVLTCTSTPPTGGMSGASAGTITSPTTFNICGNTGPYTFHINPTDAGGYHITMTATGLPAGATFTIVGNGTTAPLGTFSWTTTGIAPGSYIFYINYEDDGCPLAGVQTIAYTITVLPTPSETVALVSPATCVKKAVFTVTPGGSAAPWTIKTIQGGTTVQTITGVTGITTDSLVPGAYTIRIVNPDGCFVDTAITLAAPSIPVPSVTVTAALCPGAASGTATITATSGLAPYLYAIGGGTYTSSGAFTGLTPGSYTLHILDANTCRKDTTVTVPDATPTLINISIKKPVCDTYSNGSVIINAYNSIAPYTYALGTGAYSSNDTFSHLGAGTYTFHVKNANGCIVDTTVTLVDSIAIHGSLTIAPILCNGGAATVTITATGSTAIPYTYSYNTNPFVASGTFTLTAGSYSLHVRDVNTCYWDTSITLTQPLPLTIAPAITNVLCHGTATGAVIVTAGGGTPGFQYNIDAGTFGPSPSFTGLSAGIHIVIVQDANGCTKSDTIAITQPPAITIDSVIMVKPLCNAGSNGSITVYASGGVAPLNYAIGGGSFGVSHTFTGLPAGSYILHVQDANGCMKDTTVSLLQPTAIVPAATVTPSLCQTLANGRVIVSATGGVPAYSFAVGAGAYSSSGIFSPLAAGTYTFHVKDANGCIKDTIITVRDSMRISGVFTITAALCHSQASGSIDVTGTGGTSPYLYGIGSGGYGATHLFGSLLAGTYMIHIEDNNGCKKDTAVNVSQPAAITSSVTVTDPSCYGYNNGSITVSASGGTPAFVYSLNGGAFGFAPAFSSLTAGRDSLVIKDANGCLWDTLFLMHQPPQIYISSLAFTNISCFNGANGTVTVFGTGATPPYMYATNGSPWQAGNVFTGFHAGVVIVQVKDNNGCETDTTLNLTQPSPLIITAADTVNPTCPGYKDGAVTLHVAGGTSPYTFSDDNINYATSNAFTGLAAGGYTFNIKDANGCLADTAITLKGLPQIIVDSIGLTQPLCFDGGDGSLTVVAGGGAPPFTYRESAVTNSSGAFSGLSYGVYTITITDRKKCSIDTTVQLPQPDSLAIALNIIPNECRGATNEGSITANVTGGTQPYSYRWSTEPPQLTSTASALSNGYYTVQVTDANNCTLTRSSVVMYDNCCTPFIPNAFTPNNDGKNDEFMILFKGDMFIEIFSIYNRFGQQVYSISNASSPVHGWDGKFQGVDAEVGTYYYYARIICGNKGTHKVEYKGDITLIR